jgi:phage terminase small subunit
MGASRKIGGLTTKQRHFIKEYVKNGGNGQLAIQKSYPNANPKNAGSMACNLLNDDKVKNKIIEALDKEGLNEDYIAQTLHKNIPDEAIGKGATATTINKSLELLLKLREPVRESKSMNLNYTVFQDISNLSNKELIDKRSKISKYFDKILND